MQVMQAQGYAEDHLQAEDRQGLRKAGIYLFLCLMALIVLFPFYWMLISSVKSLAEYRLSKPTFWPQQV